MPDAAPVVLIGEGLWKSQFASDPNVVGKTMTLGAHPHVITGVVSSRFDFQDFGDAPEVWVPFQLDPNSNDQGHFFQVADGLKSLSLLLAAIGIYGLMSYSVEQRQQEIGIRMALGAERGNVRTMVVQQGMAFAVFGLLIGMAGAFALAKQISSLLFGVAPWDPIVFATIPAVLLLAAIVAVWLPANRATRVDPAIALRQS
jgi:hypothetical protein